MAGAFVPHLAVIEGRTVHAPSLLGLLVTALQASLAAYHISCWVRAIVEYDSVVKYVAPKRARLAVAEAEFNALAQSLQDKRVELMRVQARLADLADRLRCAKRALHPRCVCLRPVPCALRQVRPSSVWLAKPNLLSLQ